jgi:hypothetical protein
LYRFVPASPADPFTGTLQALAVVGSPTHDTSSAMAIGVPVPIAWIDVPDPDPAADQVGSTARSAGAAVVRRGEGLWIHDGIVYFTATNGGPVGSGQVFRLVPDGDGGTLELIAQSTDRQTLDFPDNLCVSPGGGVVLAEDGEGPSRLGRAWPGVRFRSQRVLGQRAGGCLLRAGWQRALRQHAARRRYAGDRRAARRALRGAAAAHAGAFELGVILRCGERRVGLELGFGLGRGRR